MATQTTEMDSVVSLGGDEIETVVENSSVALVEFYTEWCGTCKRMEPVLEALAEDTDATILTIDIESNLETAIEFGAQSAPTFVLFVDGQPVKQLRGGQNEQTLRDLIAQYRD
ncbi:thioredoxin family protein [Haloarcula nitratireducens]|uniref:Thioredoxin family protein n=1 Tax=Haloarcula nitratireducens TaxID=2487749 RepID=A0AAW4PIG2_9EURY|nr:thioredoxin family protein [Halomicroarcula nitratireducens]MBX0297599.1 thioredoxin family protein [Halomicroarcula nitratireducens]